MVFLYHTIDWIGSIRRARFGFLDSKYYNRFTLQYSSRHSRVCRDALDLLETGFVFLFRPYVAYIDGFLYMFKFALFRFL